MLDFNQIMQMAALNSALQNSSAAGQANAQQLGQQAQASASPAMPQMPTVPTPQAPTTPQAPSGQVPTQVPGQVQAAGNVPGMGGEAMAGVMPGQMPVSGVGGGSGGVSGGVGQPMPTTQMAGATNPTQMQKTGWDRFSEWMGGGMAGNSPEAIADRENFRKMNTIMALGTALGGSIAGGPGASVVGDVSAMLNQVAQGNIMASNAQEKELSMNDLMNRQISALSGQPASGGMQQGTPGTPGGAAPGVNQAVMPGQQGAGTSGSALANTPTSAPTPTATISSGGQNMTVADLEKRMASLFA